MERPCAWKPLCLCLAKECGGWRKAGCKTFGSGGKILGTTNEELRAARKKLLAKPKLDRDCFWWPHCSAGVLQCNGYKASLCKVYGTNRLLESPNMDSSEVKAAREAQRNDARGAQQRLRNFQKKSKTAFQQNETNGTSPSEVNEMTAIMDE